MGKYSKVVKTLPFTTGQEPTYQEKIDEAKRILRLKGPLPAARLAAAYIKTREEKEAIEAELKEAELRMEVLVQLLGEQFEEEGLSSVKLENGDAISVWLEPHTQVANRTAFREWCIREGLGEQLTLPWQTTNALAKQRLLDGEPPPDGVTIFSKLKVRLASGSDGD